MNKNLFESKWKIIRAQSNTWWSLVTDHDLDRVAKGAVKFDKYVTMLQVKYGFTREEAKKEIGNRVSAYEANPHHKT